MKQKLISLLLVLMLAASLVPAMAENTPANDPVLATVNGKDILKSQVEALIPTFLNQQYIADASDYRSVLQSMVQREVLDIKSTELGFDQFTQEEQDAFLTEAQAQLDQAIRQYAQYYQSEATPEALELATRQAEAAFLAQGITQEVVADGLKANAINDKMAQHLLGDYQPTEEEVQALFQEVGAMYQENYENDVATYEYMTQYSGQSSWYTPEGYRGVLHILLNVDDELLKNYQTLHNAYEEQQQMAQTQPAEGEAQAALPAETITEAAVEEARQAVLDSRKAEIDQITQRLAKGESFVDLVKEYGQDPGMTVEANLQDGYSIHAQSVIYDPVFTAGAFSDKVQNIGDVSDPVVGMYGIHIIMYLRDVPSGLIMTDAIRSEIEDYLLNLKQNDVYQKAMDEWLPQVTITYNEEAIQQAIDQAAAQLKSPEELPLEALPDQEDGE